MALHVRRPAWRETRFAACLVAVVILGAVSAAAAAEPGPWRQPPEPMPLASAAPASGGVAPKPELAPWIWGPDEKREYRLTKAFQGGAKAAVLVATCDNSMKLFVNGTEVATSDTWEAPIAIDVTQHLRDGDNELAVIVRNAGGLAGFSCRLVLTDPDGGVRVIESDQSWSAFDTLSPPNPVAVRVVAGPGNGPWGDVLAAARKVAAAPFTVPDGFRVERLFVVPKDDLGSWVVLTTDPQGSAHRQ